MTVPILRPALPEDLPRLVPFVTAQMPGGRPLAYYQRAMSTRWASSHPNIGYLLESEGEVVGCFFGIYSVRTIRGRAERICNLSSWCVAPSHRNASVDLVKAMLRQPGVTFTALAATRELQEFWRRMRLSLLDHGMWVFPPVAAPQGLRPLRVVTDPDALAQALDPEECRLLADHAIYGCRGAVLRDGDRRCFLILQRRQWSRFGFAYVLHASDWDFAAGHLLTLARVAWRLFRTPLVGMDQRRLARRPLLARPIPRDTFFLSPTLGAQDLDSLYSEVVLTYATEG